MGAQGHSPVIIQQELKYSFHTPTGDAWRTSFLRHLKSEFDLAPDQQQQIVTRIGDQAQAIFNASLHAHPHMSTRIALGVCSLILAAYRELCVELDSASKAYDRVERCFAKTYQAFIRNVCKPLFLSLDPSAATLDKLNFKSWSEHLYGTNPGSYAAATDLGSPGYLRFFRKHDEPALAHMMHAIDQAWIETAVNYVQLRRTENNRSTPRASMDDSGFLPFQFAPRSRTRSTFQPDVVQELQTSRTAKIYADAERRWRGASVDHQATAW